MALSLADFLKVGSQFLKICAPSVGSRLLPVAASELSFVEAGIARLCSFVER